MAGPDSIAHDSPYQEAHRKLVLQYLRWLYAISQIVCTLSESCVPTRITVLKDVVQLVPVVFECAALLSTHMTVKTGNESNKLSQCWNNQ